MQLIVLYGEAVLDMLASFNLPVPAAPEGTDYKELEGVHGRILVST